MISSALARPDELRPHSTRPQPLVARQLQLRSMRLRRVLPAGASTAFIHRLLASRGPLGRSARDQSFSPPWMRWVELARLCNQERGPAATPKAGCSSPRRVTIKKSRTREDGLLMVALVVRERRGLRRRVAASGEVPRAAAAVVACCSNMAQSPRAANIEWQIRSPARATPMRGVLTR